MVIPAASIEGLTVGNKERIPFSAMLAARLDPRKQIDLAILAAIKVKEKLPHFHLNIYGKGSQYDKLNQIILENNAQEYIKLCGYQKLTDEFKKYQLYLSTSAWETLGITLLEAVANGLGIVGLDAPYGGPTFIENTNNGYLIAENESKSRDELIENISEAIIKYYELNYTKIDYYTKCTSLFNLSYCINCIFYASAILLNVSPVILYVVQYDIGSAQRDR